MPAEKLTPAHISSAVSRRTLAKTAAWSAPAILLSTAMPAFAASATAGVLALTGAPFSFNSNEKRTVSGTITPTSGAVPTDIVLSATVSAPFTITKAPVVSGTTFSFEIQAPGPAATGGSITVRSVNYSGYTPATGGISSLAPAPAGLTPYLVPLANSWQFDGEEDGIRWYTTVPTKKLTNPASGCALLDLRTSFYGTSVDNLGNAPFVSSPKVGGWPIGFTMLGWGSQTKVTLRRGPATIITDPTMVANSVKTTIAKTSGTGNWTGYGTVTTKGKYIPYSDLNGHLVDCTGYSVSVPKRQANTQADVTIVQYVQGAGGALVTMGFRFTILQTS